MKIGLAGCAGLLALLGVGCQKQREESDGRPLVVATVTMVHDLVKEVGGERVRVEGLMGPGIDPHTYKPKITDAALLEEAAAVFYCGLHLEGKMQESLEKLAERRGGVHAVTGGIPEEMLLEPQEDFEGHYDPHVWGDPELWKETVKVVVQGLSEIDPEGAEYYEERGSAYEKRLEELKAWALERVAEVPEDQRLLVTSHDAFFYFGRGFGFEVRGLQGVSTVSEPGLKDRAELVKFIGQRGIRTIFPETSVNPKAIAAVAAEAGVRASGEELFSDAMGTPGDVVELHGERYDKGTYVGMVKHNVNSIVDGLK
ncbi:MAG: zinc ABC transporter substrate-binding protein [Verrucomicrobia bacterium]|nr:zinc ABC transporter substrate-binding protein [Verrucomicrobiota bacterium]MDA1006120.1 zinc ABC transporter substrate-binding protein [Verrucomicrobiota bacterium]